MAIYSTQDTSQNNSTSNTNTTVLPWINLSLLPTELTWQVTLKAELSAIAGNFPVNQADHSDDRKRVRGTLLIGDIAIAAGFSISNGSTSFTIANLRLDKLTYYMAFVLPFKKINTQVGTTTKLVNNLSKFTDWYNAANRVRLQHWKDNIGTPNVTIYKRMSKNGEEEIWTSSSAPTSELIPAIEHHLNNTKSKYDYFDIDIHKQIEPGYFTNGVTQVSVPYYLKSQIEAPFLSHWLMRSRSYPYNVTNDNGIPYPISGYTEVKIKNIKGLDSANQFMNVDFFCATSWTRPSNYAQFPVIDSIVTNNPIAQLNDKVKINAFKKRKTFVTISNATTKDLREAHNNKTFTILENGTILSYKGVIIKDSTGLNNYSPDIFNSLRYAKGELKTRYDAASDRIYVEEIEPTILYGEPSLPLFFEAANLIGHRIYKINAAYSVLVPDDDAEGGYLNPDVKGTKFIIGNSGVTIGIGIDVGNAWNQSDDEPNPTRRSYFENSILAPNSPNWVSMSGTERGIIKSVYGIKQSAAENIWLRNIKLFNRLNLQLDDNSFYNVLKNTVGFARQFYFNEVLTFYRANDLVADLNVVEEYVILTLYYNNPSSIRGKSIRSKFINAINAHSYSQLLAAVSSIPKDANFSKGAVTTRLKGASFKKYYNQFHFHNL